MLTAELYNKCFNVNLDRKPSVDSIVGYMLTIPESNKFTDEQMLKVVKLLRKQPPSKVLSYGDVFHKELQKDIDKSTFSLKNIPETRDKVATLNTFMDYFERKIIIEETELTTYLDTLLDEDDTESALRFTLKLPEGDITGYMRSYASVAGKRRELIAPAMNESAQSNSLMMGVINRIVLGNESMKATMDMPLYQAYYEGVFLAQASSIVSWYLELQFTDLYKNFF